MQFPDAALSLSFPHHSGNNLDLEQHELACPMMGASRDMTEH